MVRSGDLVAACHFADEVVVNQRPCKSNLHVVSVATAFVACQIEVTWIAWVLPKMATNVETLCPSKFLHQTLCVVAETVAAVVGDLMGAQLVQQLSQQRLLRQCRYGGFDVG